MYNKVILIGRLGAKPTIKQAGETKVASLSVATSTYRKLPSGEFEEQTEWNRVTVFGEATGRCEKMDKGDIVMVEGTLRTHSYDDKDNIKRYVTEVIGIAKKVTGSKPVTQQTEEPKAKSDESSDDLPF